MKIRKILLISTILSMLAFASFTPTTINVLAATSDTIAVTFDPQGNISIEVYPSTYDFGSFWSDSNESTTSHYFTFWNNGTVDNMVTDIQTTGSPANLASEDNGIPQSDNEYALQVWGTTCSASPWVPEGPAVELDSDLDRSGTETFGFNLYLSNITSDWGQQTITVTLSGALT